MDLKDLLKKAGKGLLVTAASVVAGATLGPLAAGAVGSFLSKSMGQIGVAVSQEIIDEILIEKIQGSAEQIVELATPKKTEETAQEIAQKTGLPVEDITAALQYSLRELQGELNGIVMELSGNSMLLAQVLQMASETGTKIDQMMSEQSRASDAIEAILQRLGSMERGLDISFRRFITSYSEPAKLDYKRLQVISQLQRQRTVIASGFGIRYDPSMYVPRTAEESNFNKFVGEAGMTDRNIFVVLGNVGLGKTWFMARMSSQSLEAGFPTFFVPLSHGIKALTSVFQVETLPALVDLIDPILDAAKEHAFIFLDGLDEMDPSNIRALMGALATARSDSVSFVLSCRVADWTSNRAIVRGADEIKYFIYDVPQATAAARGLRVNTPVSVLMSEFTETEMKAAMRKYGLPEAVPFDLLPLLSRPYIMRLSADWYRQVGSLPSPSSPEFLDLFAGGPEYTDSVFRRLGILTERDSLYATVEKLIQAQKEHLQLFELPIEPESTTFSTLVSSGMLRITLDRSGTLVSVNPEFFIPLCSLAILRYQGDASKVDNLLGQLERYMPDKAQIISRIVKDVAFPDSMATPPEKPVGPTSSVTTTGTGTPGSEPAAKPDKEPAIVGREPTPPPPSTAPPSTPPKKAFGQFGFGRPAAASVTPPAEPPSTTPPKKGLGQSFGRPASTTPAREVSAPSSAAVPVGSVYPEPVRQLFFLLNDRDIHVKRAAAMAMGLALSTVQDPKERLKVLSPYLDDSDTELRTGALWGIATAAATLKDPNERIQALQPLVSDGEWAIRRNAAFGMCIATGRMTKVADRKAVYEPLLANVDGQVRSGALEGLGFAAMSYDNPDDVIQLLEKSLTDSFDHVRGAAALGLGLVHSAKAECAAAVDKLSPLPQKGHGRVRIGALLSLCLIGSKMPDCSGVVRTVTPLLKHKESDLRSAAAVGLGLASFGLPDPTDMDDLLEPLLKDDEPDVRFAAALGLGLVATKVANPGVKLKPLTSHKDEFVRAGAAIGLGLVATRFPDPTDMLSLLKDLAKDTERSVRKSAVLGIGLAATKLKGDKRFEVIKPFTADSDPAVRRSAALALGVACTEAEIPVGTILGEVFWGNTPLQHDECVVAGIATSLRLRYGF
ncbi:MAG: HEAT repeat domain-containing protein [Candidatus Thorarchaeota archaeon]|nr:HEAT repeat domain-containing protein [Candidatus Thorarchaeota archaeon]